LANPAQSFLGFLPVLTSFEGGYSIMPLRQAAGKYMINHPIPASVWEWKRAHKQIILDESGGMALPMDSLLDRNPVEAAMEQLAGTLLSHLGVEIPKPEEKPVEPPKKEVGALTRLWRMAIKGLGAKATVEGYVR
jgi:hypothetical protein